ncbi:hypothetical protein [Bradyrhizobium sp. CB1015]|uniref:hypothetical protein n=1 Tax=Bradyrhizobium sp. CB1015 TaxID=2976822 RepID=UPI0021A9D6DA|nr:hypothetical protein [Bradyrhizobium sp. CB1015]UWU94359.1 hypothetical protein N2604_11190 [Bradyrhizobium sp. CB1015]
MFQAILWTNALMSHLKSRPLVPYEDYLQRQRRKVKIDLMRRHELRRSARARWAAKRRRQPAFRWSARFQALQLVAPKSYAVSKDPKSFVTPGFEFRLAFALP